MKIESIKRVHAFDRDTGSALLVNGKVIAACNYDEHGSAGESLLDEVSQGLANLSGINSEVEELDDHEYHRLLVGQSE